jgi:lipid-A-disaccharide synthase-like uncharacterized protein
MHLATLTPYISELLNPWIIVGFLGQFIFFLRFLVQWFLSEKKHEVVVPISFWYLSIVGSLIILIYSIHIKDIVFTSAQIFSLFIYVRNLALQKSFTRDAIALKNKPI